MDSTRRRCVLFSASLAPSPTLDWAGGEFHTFSMIKCSTSISTRCCNVAFLIWLNVFLVYQMLQYCISLLNRILQIQEDRSLLRFCICGIQVQRGGGGDFFRIWSVPLSRIDMDDTLVPKNGHLNHVSSYDQVVAESMNNYLMFDRLLKCSVVPKVGTRPHC